MNSTSLVSEVRTIADHKLTWHRWLPEKKENDELKGALFFIHGQGDFGERYQEIAEFFLKEGIAFATCDLPGHGRSNGRRGHIPSWEIVREVASLGLAEARELVPGKPVGLAGHSVGGLLVLFLLGELTDEPDFSWISSPCLKPEAGQPSWRVSLLRILSHLIPSLTVSTGVAPDMCREDFEDELANQEHQFHSRISLSWGRTLLELAEVARTQPERLPSSLPLLFTQGESDRICPPQYCEELVRRFQRDNLELKLYPDTRHEPFADQCRQQVFSDLSSWLAKVL